MVVSKHAFAVATIAFVLLIVLSVFYVREREQRIQAEGISATDKALSASLQKSIDQRNADVRSAEEKTAAAIKAMTPAAAQQVITRIVTVPGAPVDVAPVEVTKQEIASGDVQAKLPDSPSYTVLTQEQSLTLAKNQLQCELSQTKLDACTANAADYQQQVELANQRADAFERALKGGTWLQRAWRVAKPVGCAIGGAAAGSYVKGTQGAAIGAAASGALCAVAF